ncbi:MAG: hypothetical protein ACTSQB_00145 [Candidatus Heimdallarchaeota archaeon]
MKQLIIYQRIKQLVLAQDYTVTQVENATFSQVVTALSLSQEEQLELSQYWKNIKRHCIRIVQNKQDQKRLAVFHERFLVDNRVWLEDNYPNIEFTHGTRDGSKYWLIWPEGKV